ncbi:GntR family transcriptional regulator [Streptomyces bikiniensis]|uniref:GntR family transcriptional regulator n=1 Tax=Streptomyces bikiniensis TaxID=1896 RepID=A0ABW8CKT1_STRBI
MSLAVTKGSSVPATSPRGTYQIIAASLRQQIEGGEISGALPSEAALVRSFGVARNTIRRALKALEAERLVESVPGTGWRVARDGASPPLLDLLTELIADDALEVGDPYPSETQLCERFQVSRTALRSALAQLEGRGLLDTVHGKGRTVRALPGSPGQP